MMNQDARIGVQAEPSPPVRRAALSLTAVHLGALITLITLITLLMALGACRASTGPGSPAVTV